MKTLDTFFHQLSLKLSDSGKHLLNAIRQHLRPPTTSSQAGVTYTASKTDVLASLAEVEGSSIDTNVARQRIKRINSELKDPHNNFIDNGAPVASFASNKTNFSITFSDTFHQTLEAAESEAKRKVLAQSGSHSRKREVPENPEENQFIIPQYQIFISHKWGGEDQETIVDDFVGRLERKLQGLPQPWAGKFTVWFDRSNTHGRGANFTPQVKNALEESHFAIFLVSNAWCQSEICQMEAEAFFKPESQSSNEPYLFIQLNGSRQDLRAPYKDFPSLPERYHAKPATNLLELWGKANANEKDQFIQCMVQAICAHFAITPALPHSTSAPLHKMRTHKQLREIAKENALEGKIFKAKIKQEFTATDNKINQLRTTPAVKTLVQWVTNPSEPNFALVLGSFGMGKTVTAQLFNDALNQRLDNQESVPVPIYLDFRRLIAEVDLDKDTNADTLIHKALSPEVQRSIKVSEVAANIHSGNCVVIFDGLDELGNRLGVPRTAAIYRQFLELINPPTQIGKHRICLLVTCRSHFYRDIREQESFFDAAHRQAAWVTQRNTYHMAPFTSKQVRELLGKTLGDTADTVYKIISKIHDLEGLAKRPIMARYIGELADQLIAKHQAKEVINIATIYEQLFEQSLLRDEDKLPLLTIEDRRDLLIALAQHWQCQGHSTQKARQLEQWFDGFRRTHTGISDVVQQGGMSVRKLLFTELENASFLVRENDDGFRFAHISYFEYFLALNLYGELCQAEPQLAAYTNHPISRETRDFVRAIAEQHQSNLTPAVVAVLRSAADTSARQWCLAMLNDAEQPIPDAANLSGCNLQQHQVHNATWRNINLGSTQLQHSYFERVHFHGCDFSDAGIGNAYFKHCQFINCTGTPNGSLASRGQISNDNTATTPPWPIHPPHWCKPQLGSTASVAWRFSGLLSDSILDATFNHDGSRVVTASNDKTARIWDAHSGQLCHTLEGHGDCVWYAAFNHDGSRVVTASDDKTARIWNAHSGELCHTLEGHGGWGYF